MKQLFALILVFTITLLLSGCNAKGSSAPPPTNVAVVAGDTSATLTWDMLPGVNYWVFKAAGTDVTPESCVSQAACTITMKATSPLVISGLTNGTTYAFTINGRIDGGPGGAGSPSVQAVPRLAGATWDVGAANSAGTNDLHGITYGAAFVATGGNSAIFSSTDGQSWTAATTINWLGVTAPSTLPTLNATTNYGGNYVAVGEGGVILTSPDAITWTQQTNPSTQPLYAVTSGAGGYVATGATGTILQSNDGTTWNIVPPISTNALYGIGYGNGQYIATGAAGSLLISTNGTTWNVVTSNSTNELRSVSYGAGTFVVVGNNGALLTSPDGAVWTTQTVISTTLIYAVTYGRQFVAVDNIGGIYTSTDGISWTPQTSSINTALYAVTHGPYDYTAVGAGGTNLHAK